MSRSSKIFVTAIAAGLLGFSGTAVANPADSYDPAMLDALSSSLGISPGAAAARLDSEGVQQQRLTELRGSGAAVDGAFFVNGQLTVNAADKATSAKAKAKGLAVRTGARGAAALERISADLDSAASAHRPDGVNSWAVDLATDAVVITVQEGRRSAATEKFLAAAAKHGSAVRVETTTERLAPTADVYPGSKMTFSASGGGWCSVGFGATNSSGQRFLVTAGHCVEGLPDLYLGSTHFGKATHTRFGIGQDSVDMGIARIDAEDRIMTSVGTWGAAGTVAVRGANRAAVGSTICKSGATTGWTCGNIKSYNVTVTYTDPNGGPQTVVRGLGSSSVCTAGGDSGGAYISGNQAQGMTSGGPMGQTCAFNGGNIPGKSSYFQPLSDALSYYGLSVQTAS
ncbi:S1 family peptidase [Allokutzneria albata]|uniref:Trypsin n=1 Tax=Allokutzneria albata TaxID=211114 RepID=A0A1G9X5N8_ALLAB|nr:S1 family peptidase [Allokutzneria albata]SDM92039.1 Trypsin [Allokutzneria albata]